MEHILLVTIPAFEQNRRTLFIISHPQGKQRFSRFKKRPIIARDFESSILFLDHILKWKDCQVVDPIGFSAIPFGG